jgi:hypothetical protein
MSMANPPTYDPYSYQAPSAPIYQPAPPVDHTKTMTIALILAGAAGVGIYLYFRKK